MRSALIAITERSVAVRSMIMMRRASLRERLRDISQQNGEQRLNEQKLFLRFSHVIDDEIKKLESNSAELEKERREKIGKIIEIRKFRKGLDKLRDDARTAFISEQEKQEQKELDDKTTTTFARKIMQRI